MTENTFRTAMPIAFGKVIFSENHTPTKIPCKDLCFQRYLHLLDGLLLSVESRVASEDGGGEDLVAPLRCGGL
jgi:hypothetical protein